MVRKQKSIAQLKREIAEQRRKIAKQKTISGVISQRQRLSQELFQLRNQRFIQAGEKAKRLSKRFGRKLLNVGRVVDPVLKKQARLIRDQQLRDDAIIRFGVRKLSKKKPRRKSKRKPVVNIH